MHRLLSNTPSNIEYLHVSYLSALVTLLLVYWLEWIYKMSRGKKISSMMTKLKFNSGQILLDFWKISVWFLLVLSFAEQNRRTMLKYLHVVFDEARRWFEEKKRLFLSRRRNTLENVVLNGTMYFCYRWCCNCPNYINFTLYNAPFFPPFTFLEHHSSSSKYFDISMFKNATYKNLYASKIPNWIFFFFFLFNETNRPPLFHSYLGEIESRRYI